MSQQALRAAATGQPAPGTAISPFQTVQRYFTQHKDQIAAALPKHLNADRMCRLALTALSQNKALMECDAKSIFGCVITASQLGLEIGVLGQAYLVPYKGQATLIPGWQGLTDLVARAGRASVWTGAVFEGDEFEYQQGDSPFVRHRPCGEDDPKKLQFVYAIGRVNKGEWPVVEVWPAKRVWKHRDRFNKVGQRHYSFENPEMYARKVVLLQVLKYMPKSIEIAAAVELSARNDEGGAATLSADFMVIDNEDIAAIPGHAIAVTETTEKAPEPAQDATTDQPAPTQPIDKDHCLALVADAKSPDDLDYINSLAKDYLAGKDLAEVKKAIADVAKAE